MSRQGSEGVPQVEDLRREEMLMPDEVAAMVGLRGLGWGAKRIARAQLPSDTSTVKVCVPGSVGVPVTSPFSERLRPVGSAPLARVQT